MGEERAHFANDRELHAVLDEPELSFGNSCFFTRLDSVNFSPKAVIMESEDRLCHQLRSLGPEKLRQGVPT